MTDVPALTTTRRATRRAVLERHSGKLLLSLGVFAKASFMVADKGSFYVVFVGIICFGLPFLLFFIMPRFVGFLKTTGTTSLLVVLVYWYSGTTTILYGFHFGFSFFFIRYD